MEKAEPIVQPRIGRVLGCGWGDCPEQLRARHPDARPARDVGDVRTWTSTPTIDEEGPPTQAMWSFHLDGLVAVDLCAPPPWDPARARRWFARAAPVVLAGFSGRPTRRDEGFEELSEGAVRIALDRIDARIRLEEAEP